jgi:hypothetical protein
LEARLDKEEPKTTALQSLTATHTTDIASNTNNIASLDTRLDAEEPKTTALQTLTAGHTTDLASNTADILTKQDLITTATDLDCNSLTTGDLEVNGGVNIITKPHFDTIVFRRPNNTPQINLNEIQCWVGGVNILPTNSNDLIGYFADWDLDKSYPSGDTGSRQDTGQVSKLYNDVIEGDFGAHRNQFSGAVRITNIPLTAVEDIQALVLYNRQNSTEAQESRIVNMFFELYNSTYDPTYTTPLATTTPITTAQQACKVFHFEFASISTYTEFILDNSITNIVSNSFAETADGIFPAISTLEITGDVAISGSITASNKYF